MKLNIMYNDEYLREYESCEIFKGIAIQRGCKIILDGTTYKVIDITFTAEQNDCDQYPDYSCTVALEELYTSYDKEEKIPHLNVETNKSELDNFDTIGEVLRFYKDSKAKQNEILTVLEGITNRNVRDWQVILDNYNSYEEFEIASKNDEIKTYCSDVLIKEYYYVQIKINAGAVII